MRPLLSLLWPLLLLLLLLSLLWPLLLLLRCCCPMGWWQGSGSAVLPKAGWPEWQGPWLPA